MHLREASLPPPNSRCFPKLGDNLLWIWLGHMCVCVCVCTSHWQFTCKYVWWRTTSLLPFIIEIRSWTPFNISIKCLEFRERIQGRVPVRQARGKSGEDVFHPSMCSHEGIGKQRELFLWPPTQGTQWEVGETRLYSLLSLRIVRYTATIWKNRNNPRSRALKAGLSPWTFDYGAACEGDASHTTFPLCICDWGAWSWTEWKKYIASLTFY